MRKRLLYSCMLAVALTMSITGCKKKEPEIKTIEYSENIGTAEGIVDFESEEEPEIDIKEIRAYKGENIDYSSGIDIKNVDKFEDFQMWVDSTGVDIYVPGKYIAVYRFVYNGKTVEENVSVTIMEKEEEQQVSTYSSANNLASNNESQGSGSAQGNAGNSGSQSNNSSDATEPTTPQENAGSSGSGGTAQNPEGNDSQGTGTSQQPIVQPPAIQQPPVTQQPTAQQPVTQKPTAQQPATQKPASQQTTTAKQPETSREIVTTKKTSTDKISTIGYTNIELLSGTYVKIKCTNAKYIVSTRTDTSTTVKNGVNYEVAKLIVTFNTGAEQVLETVETVMK